MKFRAAYEKLRSDSEAHTQLEIFEYVDDSLARIQELTKGIH